MTLALFLVFASFGPWGVFLVSEKSQVERLEVILTSSEILVNGNIKGEVLWEKKSLPELESPDQGRNSSRISDSLYSEISSILHYLHKHHGLNSINSWFSQDMNHILKAANEDKLKFRYLDGPSIYLETLGLSSPFRNAPENYYHYQANWNLSPLLIGGYDYLYNFSISNEDPFGFTLQGDLGSLQINSSGIGLELLLDQKIIEIPLTKRFDKWMSDYPLDKGNLIPVAEMAFEVEGQNQNILLIIQSINFQKRAEEESVLQSVSGFLLLQDR